MALKTLSDGRITQMTVYEKRKRKDRNQRIKWMLQDVISLCLMVIIMAEIVILIKGLI